MNRNLRFKNLKEALVELDRLEKGKVVTGKLWSYFQILTHCADSINYSMTSYPRLLPGIVRQTAGKYFFKKMLKNGFMKMGAPNPSAPKEREEGDEITALSRLRKTISAFEKFEGPFAIHPIFDKLNKEEWTKLHSFHLANHLGFADIDENEVTYQKRKATPKKIVAPKKKSISKTAKPKKKIEIKSKKKKTR